MSLAISMQVENSKVKGIMDMKGKTSGKKVRMLEMNYDDSFMIG